MLSVKTNPGRCLMGRLAKGDDLLQALEKVCQEHNITLGEVRALGAVTRAKVGFYDQAQRNISSWNSINPWKSWHWSGTFP